MSLIFCALCRLHASSFCQIPSSSLSHIIQIATSESGLTSQPKGPQSNCEEYLLASSPLFFIFLQDSFHISTPKLLSLGVQPPQSLHIGRLHQIFVVAVMSDMTESSFRKSIFLDFILQNARVNMVHERVSKMCTGGEGSVHVFLCSAPSGRDTEAHSQDGHT